MTRPHLRRSLVVVAASALFAAAASGSAMAWSGTVRQVAVTSPAPAFAAPGAVTQRAVAVAPAAPVASVAAPSRPAKQRATASTKPRATAVTKPAKPRAATAPGSGTIRITHYVDSPGSQAQIDACHLVLWTHSPLWLAGHNWCGYQWMAFVPTGTTVVVTGGAADGHYVVTGHLTLHRQSGSLPSLSADLVLQTCVGSSTGLTLLHRA